MSGWGGPQPARSAVARRRIMASLSMHSYDVVEYCLLNIMDALYRDAIYIGFIMAVDNEITVDK